MSDTNNTFSYAGATVPPKVYTALEISDAQKVASDAAVAANNALENSAAKVISTFTQITERNPILNPQQIADGFQVRNPGSGREIYYNISNALKLLAWSKSGVLDREYWLVREWISVDDGSLIATQVPWSPTTNTGLQICATKAEAIAKSHKMLADWIAANTIPAKAATPAVYAADGVTVLQPAQPATPMIVPTSPVAFKGAL